MSPLLSNSLNVNQLIEACLRGEANAYRDLFDCYKNRLMTLCRRYTRSNEEAEDLLQDGFIKVFTHLHTYQFTGSFEGWMKKIFVNIALNAVSKKAFQYEEIGLDHVKEGIYEADIISQMTEDQILQIISQLPDGYRTVFNLYVIEGYSHKEIGEMLEIEESTSRSQLLKARKILQEKINDLHKVAI